MLFLTGVWMLKGRAKNDQKDEILFIKYRPFFLGLHSMGSIMPFSGTLHIKSLPSPPYVRQSKQEMEGGI